MKKGTTLLMALGLMMATTVSAQAETVTDYVVGFNTPIETSAHNFKVADGWSHIVDYFSSVDRDDYPYDYYVEYSYEDDNGLKIGNQRIGPDWADSERQDVYDLLVTPEVSGEVTLSVKQFNYNGYVEFYTISDGKKGEIIGTQHKSDLSTDNFTTISLTIDEPTKIGIRGSRVYLNGFTAASANIEANKLMKVISAESNGAVSDNSNGGKTGLIKWPADPTHKNANGNNMVKVSYMVTVQNDCAVTLNPGDTNYSVSIVNSKLSEPIVTVAVPQTLAPGETSEPFEVTGYVNPFVDYNTSKDYPTPWSYSNDSQPFNIRENLDGTILERANGAFVPYEHSLVFRKKGTTTTSKFSSAETVAFGIVTEETTVDYEIFNNGVAPLVVSGLSINAPFTTGSTSGFTLNTGETQDVSITFPATASGSCTGNLTITYIDNDDTEKTVTLAKLSGTMLAEGTWMADFGDGTSSSAFTFPEGSVAESSVNSDYTYISSQNYNNYIKSTSSSSNKFYTPLLHANAGDSMSFNVKRYSSTHSLKVYLTHDRTQLGEPIYTVNDLSDTNWTMKSFTVDTEGDYYVVFELYNVYFDEIVGLSKVDVTSDLHVKDLGSYSSTEYQSGEQISKEMHVIAPIGAKATDYTVEMMLGDEVVKTLDSKDIAAHAKNAATFSGSFTKEVSATSKLDFYWRFTFTDGKVYESDRTELTLTCEPHFSFVTKGTSDSKYAPTNKTAHNFGKVNEANLTAEYEIFNWGKGELTINSVTMPEGFSTTFTAPATIAGKAHVDFPIVFSADEIGIYGGNVVINFVNAEGDNEDFEFAVNGTLLDVTKFYASFDGNGAVAYPAGSVRDKNIDSSNTGDYSNPNYAIYGSSATDNFFVTPLLHAEAGEAFNFDARTYSASWPEGTIKVYAATSREGLRNEETRTQLVHVAGKDIEDDALITPAFKTFTVTLAEAGDYYIGFEISGRAYVDELYGLSLVDVAHDIEVAEFTAPESAMQNNSATATVKVRNFGFDAEAANSYSAIVSVDGVETEYTGMPEIPAMLKSNDTPVSIDVPFKYGKTGTFPVSVKLQFGDYTVETEPANVEFTEEVLSADKQIGDFKELSTVPFMSNYKNAETVALYTPDQLGLSGGDVIDSITLRGWFNAAHKSDVKIAYAWVDETTLTQPEKNTKYDTSDMTVAFEQADFQWPGGGKASEITDLFTLDLNKETYTEGKSLMIVFGSYADAYKSAAYSELSTWSGNCWYRQNDGTTKGVMTGEWTAKNLPVLHISLDVEPRTISGTVTDADDQAVEGATVTLTAADGSGVEYTGTTAADGTYTINVIQSKRTYNVVASMGENEDYAEGVTFEDHVTRNFKLGTKVIHLHPAANGVEAAEGARVRINLDLEPGYHALALPFAINNDVIATLFGTDAEVYTLVGTTLEEGTLVSYFETATSVAAGAPFLVNVTETKDEVIDGVTLVAEPQVGGASSAHVTFGASYKPTSASGKFMFDDSGFVTMPDAQGARFGRTKVQAAATVPAFHATVQARPNQEIDSMNFAVNQTPTSISEIGAEALQGKAYNLRGMRSLNPSKGVYIINGKKVLVK